MRFKRLNFIGNPRGSFEFTCGQLSYRSYYTTYRAALQRAKELFKAGDNITVYRLEQ